MPASTARELGARLLTVLGLKPYLNYVGQRTYITPKRYAPQLINPIRLILLLPVINPSEEVLPRNSPPRGQPRSTEAGLAPPGTSPDKPTTASEAETASQGFQQELDSTILPTGGTTKAKDGIATSKADLPTSQTPQIQLKVKK